MGKKFSINVDSIVTLWHQSFSLIVLRWKCSRDLMDMEIWNLCEWKPAKTNMPRGGRDAVVGVRNFRKIGANSVNEAHAAPIAKLLPFWCEHLDSEKNELFWLALWICHEIRPAPIKQTTAMQNGIHSRVVSPINQFQEPGSIGEQTAPIVTRILTVYCFLVFWS